MRTSWMLDVKVVNWLLLVDVRSVIKPESGRPEDALEVADEHHVSRFRAACAMPSGDMP